MAGAILHILVGKDHIIGDRVDLTGLAEGQVILFTADGVDTHEQAVILLAVDLFEHLALAAAGSALMHEDGLHLIRGFEPCCGSVVGYPALILADVEKHREHALLRGGAGIEVICKDLVQVLAALVDNDLLAVEVSVTERRGDIDDGAGREAVLNIVDADKALHIRKRQRKERGVHRADHQAVIAVIPSACMERQHYKALGAEPLHGLLAELGELIAVNVGKARLIGGQIVANAHAVRIAAAHIILHEVDGGAVLAADDLGLLDKTLAVDAVAHVKLGGVRGAVAHLDELLLGFGIAEAVGVFQCLHEILRQNELCQISVCIHVLTSFLIYGSMSLVHKKHRPTLLLIYYHSPRDSSILKCNEFGTFRVRKTRYDMCIFNNCAFIIKLTLDKSVLHELRR